MMVNTTIVQTYNIEPYGKIFMSVPMSLFGGKHCFCKESFLSNLMIFLRLLFQGYAILFVEIGIYFFKDFTIIGGVLYLV